MANFFKSLFKGKEGNTENGKDKTSRKNFEIFKYDGLRAQRMGRVDYAVKCFTEALAIEEDFEVMSYLSQIYSHTDELEKARELLDKMIEMEPEVINTYLVASNVCFMQESYACMVDYLNRAIGIQKDNAAAHFLLAKAKRGMKANKEAIDSLTQAITLKEDYMDALLMRSELFMENKDYEKALADIDQILQLHTEEETALLLRGKLRQQTGDEAEAEVDYRKVTELNPFNEQAYINLGQLYISQKKLDEAISLFDEAIELNPNSASAYHERGRARLLNGDKEGSEADKRQAIQLKSKGDDATEKITDNQPQKENNSLGLPV